MLEAHRTGVAVGYPGQAEVTIAGKEDVVNRVYNLISIIRYVAITNAQVLQRNSNFYIQIPLAITITDNHIKTGG